MDELLAKLVSYFDSLGIGLVDIEPELIERRLPIFVSAPYRAYYGQIFHSRYLFFIARGENQPLPDQIIAQVEVVKKRYPDSLVLVFQNCSKEFCRLLVKAGISFVVPGRQLFIADKFLMFQEDKFQKNENPAQSYFSPWAQVILLYYLLHKENENILQFQTLLADLKINKVYLSRSAKELERANLAKICANGRNKFLLFDGDRKKTWQSALPYLSSPVAKKVRIESINGDFLYAGISALSEYTNLNDDPSKCFAAYKGNFVFDKGKVTSFSGDYIELWKYDPALLAPYRNCVDKLSLYLSLRKEEDPRIKSELDDMMRNFPW